MWLIANNQWPNKEFWSQWTNKDQILPESKIPHDASSVYAWNPLSTVKAKETQCAKIAYGR